MAHRFLAAILALCWSVTWAAAPRPANVLGDVHHEALAAVDSLPLPEPQTINTHPLAECPQAIELVIGFEISSPAYYERYLIKPTWPGAASGVTIGVGYDLGHQVQSVIRADWKEHEYVEDLQSASGVTGADAKYLVEPMGHIRTPLRLAESVFEQSTVPRYWQSTARAFPGIETLRPCARGALFSLVYNRGSAMAGATRKEMRAIRDECVPLRDHHCIADQIRRMERLWIGTTIENGMRRRRQAEADLVLQ